MTPGLLLPGLIALGLIAGPVGARLARGSVSRGHTPWLGLGVQALGAVAAMVLLVLLIQDALPDPRAHAYAATSFALLGYAWLHIGIALLFVISNAQRWAGGYISPRRMLDLRLTRLWQDYVAAAGLVSLAVAMGLPALL